MNKNGYGLVKCKNDGHIYVENPPVGKQLTDIYSLEYFEGSAAVGYRHNVFTASAKQLSRSERRVQKLKRFFQSGRVLDVGSGPGFFVKAASRYFEANGCDISQAAADFAKKNLQVDIWVGDFVDYPDAKNSLECITMFSQLEHTIHPEENLKKAAKLLVPEGLLIISLPNINGLPRYVQGRFWRGFSIPEHLHFFNRKNLEIVLNNAGFLLLKHKYSENNFFRDTNYFYAKKLSL
ncbi:MAG: class I SAM-dependent methyltransferase [Spirochaetia bacterium]|nr:class I SAM-dependent methyltransferase [Spirochaetia bacterium]